MAFLSRTKGEKGNLSKEDVTKKFQESDNENVADIMDTEEQEDQKIRMCARDTLDKVSGEHKKLIKESSKKELGQLDTMLPINPSTNVWREAQPVTQITDSVYPFDWDKRRPTTDELRHVYKVALCVLLNPVNKEELEELEPYVIQMFGKGVEEHERIKQYQSIAREKYLKIHSKLHLTLIKGKDMVPRHSRGKSDPYCFITIVKSEHVDMIRSAKHDVVKINEKKQLGLKIEKSKVIPNTLDPTWNQEFVLPPGLDPKSDMVLIEAWDGEETAVKLKDVHLGNVGSFLKDLGEHNSFMGRAFMPLSNISTLPRETTLTFHSRHNKHRYGQVIIQVHLVKPTVDEVETLKDHCLLTAAVLDFESHMTGKYVVGWNAKITPLGHKLISLDAGMNGITPLQQASIVFSLLNMYDKNILLSIIGYFGVVRTISLHQDQLPASPTGSEFKQVLTSFPEWMQKLIKCMEVLNCVLIGALGRHHELFSFKSEEGIEYLSLHVELIKEMYTIRPHLQRLEGSGKNLKTTIHEACVVACKIWFDTLVAEVVPILGDVKKQLLCFVEVVSHVIQRLRNAIKVQAIFKEVGIDYYTIMFKALDQQLSSQIIKYTTRRIPGGEIASYQLYLYINELLKLAENIPSKRGLHLNQYHEWFKGFVGDWISLALNKCNDEIKRAVTLIEVDTVTENVKFSQSALSADLSFKRLITFWNNVHWPIVSESYGFIIGMVEVIIEAAKLYVEESHNNLKKRNFFHDTSSKEFIVTKQLCICLNDIEYVSEQLSKIPEYLQFDTLISRLAVIEGDEQAEESQHTLDSLLDSAKYDVNDRFVKVISSVGEKMSTDITYHIKEIRNKDAKDSLVEVIDPLMQYLTKNLTTFYNLLSPPVLECMLVEIWNITIHYGMPPDGTTVKQDEAEISLKTAKELERFFHANGDGLPLDKINTDEYKSVLAHLNLWATTDDGLIDNHLKCLAKWSRSGDKKNGLLSFSVGYIQDKETLEITVVKATNLPTLGPCNPYVQISLMPKGRFHIGAVKTQHKTKDLNPEYYTEFNIKVEENFLDMSGSVLTLGIYSHHLISNEFVGMVVIEGVEIPRLPGGSSNIDDPNAPQRKTYELPLVVDTMTPALKELAKRKHKFVCEFYQQNQTIKP